MSVNLKMDGNTYQNATKINVGGKTIDIEETGGGVVGKYGKYKSVVFTPTDAGTAIDRMVINYDFGEDGSPDLIIVHVDTSDTGYIQNIVLDKGSKGGFAYGINKTTAAESRVGYSYSESSSSPANSIAFYDASSVRISRASTNITFRDSDEYIADCYWEA